MSTNIQKNQITEGIIWRQLLLFFFPILLGTFFQQLYNTIDSVIVGQFVGKEALAAVGGSSAQIVAFVVGFFTGLSSGASVTIAQFFGAKDSHFRPHLQHGIGNTARHRRFQTSALLFDRLLHHQHRA